MFFLFSLCIIFRKTQQPKTLDGVEFATDQFELKNLYTTRKFVRFFTFFIMESLKLGNYVFTLAQLIVFFHPLEI
jgi:hypothetical protein